MVHARKDYQKRIQDAASYYPSLLEPDQKPIPADEPVFLLRAQDATAAWIVEKWADLNEKLGAQAIQIEAAREHARKMRLWSKRKLSDRPAGV